jgi:hypothetical protein
MSATVATTQVWNTQMQSQTMVEVTAADGTTLDRAWRERWTTAGRTAMADWCSSSPAHCSARVATERADVFVALAAELSRAGAE